MGEIRFSKDEMNRFNDKIENVLENDKCRILFDKYLEVQDYPPFKKTLSLWIETNNGIQMDICIVLIEEIDDFNRDILKSASDGELPALIKQECSRILSQIHPKFMVYLSSMVKIKED